MQCFPQLTYLPFAMHDWAMQHWHQFEPSERTLEVLMAKAAFFWHGMSEDEIEERRKTNNAIETAIKDVEAIGTAIKHRDSRIENIVAKIKAGQ